jgi:hypothetical protein
MPMDNLLTPIQELSDKIALLQITFDCLSVYPLLRNWRNNPEKRGATDQSLDRRIVQVCFINCYTLL